MEQDEITKGESENREVQELGHSKFERLEESVH